MAIVDYNHSNKIDDEQRLNSFRDSIQRAIDELTNLLSNKAEKSDLIVTTNFPDYIVEEGTSGIWKYRKWKSGIKEVWGESTYSSAALTTQKASGVYSNDTWASASFSLPSGLFTETPEAFASVGSNGYTQCQVNAASTSAIRVRVWASYSTTISNLTVRLYAIGK